MNGKVCAKSTKKVLKESTEKRDFLARENISNRLVLSNILKIGFD